MSLCQTCIACIEGTRRPLASYSPSEDLYECHHHDRLADLQEAAASGCPLCTEVCEIERYFKWLTDDEAAKVEQEGELLECHITHGQKRGHRDEHYSLYFFYTKRVHPIVRSFERGAPMVGFYFWPSDDFSAAQFGSPESSTTSSDEALIQASRWLDECLATHISCNEEKTNDWHPSRLLDVGAYASDTDMIRLAVSSKDQFEGSYLTLSHCWGQREFLKLTRDNMMDLRSGFPTSSLPRTFQEAVQVARRLGVRYIWIDSLCIIQGDEADWYQESMQMGKVYANAICNIAATASRDDTEGLFRDRNPARMHRVECEVAFNSVGESHHRLFTVVQTHWWGSLLNDQPLNLRAWVMQERLLARRVIHFGEEEVVWECREHEACESYPLGLPSQVKISHLIGKRFFTLGTSSDTNTPETSQDLWSRFHRHYSECQLTKRNDRLVAIAGIAQKMQSVTGDQYKGGIWLANVERQIMWSTDCEMHHIDTELTTSSNVERSGPSFLWASTPEASLYSNFTDLDLHIRIDDVDIQCKNADPFGIVVSGSLHLHGTLKAIEIERLESSIAGVYTWALYAPGTRFPGEGREGMLADRMSVDHPSLDLGELSCRGSLFAMPATFDSWGESNEVWTECLILELVDAQEAKYRRVGMLRKWVGQEQHELLASLPSHKETTPCLKYEPTSDFPCKILLV